MDDTYDADDAFSTNGKYYGKYRATVFNNIDPMQMGRIQVMCSDVSALLPTSWAMPCVPLAGTLSGTYFVPVIGSGVWVEFEQGDPDYPIYVGGYWGSTAEVPAMAKAGLPASPSIVISTTGQNSLVLSDVPGPAGGIILKARTGASILINETGIVITNGQGATIALLGNTVTVNNGALTVI